MLKFPSIETPIRRRAVRRLHRDRRGAVAIEFAFIAPVLFAIILGTIDLGRYAWTASTMQNAADEAARHGAVENKALGTVQTDAIDSLIAMKYGNFTATATNVTISGVNYLQVEIVHTYNFIFPISMFSSTATMDIVSRFPKP